MHKLINVPEIRLPSGVVVPPFMVGQYYCGQGPDGKATIDPTRKPWVNVNYREARQACAAAGGSLITELQWLAIAHDIATQGINWTGGKVGEGKVYMGLHKGSVDEAQPGTFVSADPEERRWHQLSNGERIYDFAGNCFSLVFDDVQGDETGLTTIIEAGSISSTTAPFPARESGMGWRPDRVRDCFGGVIIRGGCWFSGVDAGVFYLYNAWPDNRYSSVGFRITGAYCSPN